MKRFKLKPVVKAVAETLRQFVGNSPGLYRAVMRYGEWMGAVHYAAHTAVEFFSDGAGTIYAISAGLPATYDAAGYAATTITYTSIGKPKTFPQFGSKRGLQEWTPISGGVEKGKGAPNYGGGQSTWGDVPADAGQVILKAAEASAAHYSLKITFPDGEVMYLDVLVCSWELSSASSGSPVERLCEIQLCRAPVVVAAT